MNALFWMLAIICGVMLPLIIGAWFIEVLAPKSREWVRRLRQMETGRQAQKREHDEYSFRRSL